MNIPTRFLAPLFLALLTSLWHPAPPPPARSLSDWADWRGPTRDGISYEKGLPEKWSPKGENLVWKQPFGGRSSPIVMGGRVFLFNSAGDGESSSQVRQMCPRALAKALLCRVPPA